MATSPLRPSPLPWRRPPRSPPHSRTSCCTAPPHSSPLPPPSPSPSPPVPSGCRNPASQPRHPWPPESSSPPTAPSLPQPRAVRGARTGGSTSPLLPSGRHCLHDVSAEDISSSMCLYVYWNQTESLSVGLSDGSLSVVSVRGPAGDIRTMDCTTVSSLDMLF